MLDSRLQQIADLVRSGSRLADIGTDHALLPVQLIRQGICTYVIASDVKKGPVAAATRTVMEAGFTENIAIRLGDGLSTVSPNEVDDIVIAGMGGETIAAILEAAPWVQSDHYRLILQPMTRAEKLRRFLWESGFEIEKEQVVQDGRRWYTVLRVSYTGVAVHPDLLSCYVGRIPLPKGAPYLRLVAKRLQKQQQGGCDEEITRVLQKLEEYI